MTSSGAPDPADTVEFDAGDAVYRARFRSDDCPPSEAVVEVIAAVTGRNVRDLEALYEVLDPEALNALLTDGRSGERAITFEYLDHEVTVESRGRVRIRPPKRDR